MYAKIADVQSQEAVIGKTEMLIGFFAVLLCEQSFLSDRDVNKENIEQKLKQRRF